MVNNYLELPLVQHWSECWGGARPYATPHLPLSCISLPAPDIHGFPAPLIGWGFAWFLTMVDASCSCNTQSPEIVERRGGCLATLEALSLHQTYHNGETSKVSRQSRVCWVGGNSTSSVQPFMLSSWRQVHFSSGSERRVRWWTFSTVRKARL